MIRIVISFCFFLTIFNSSAQELGKVINGNHSLKLVQNELRYSLVYSDINDQVDLEKSFNFSDKDKLYSLLIDGFNEKNHQLFLRTNKDTIVKLLYKRIKGEWKVMFKQENMDNLTKGMSSFFNRGDIQKLFGNP